MANRRRCIIALVATLGVAGSLLPTTTAAVDVTVTDEGTITVAGVRTAPTTSATPGVASIGVEWDAVPRATKYRYRSRRAGAAWSPIVQTVGVRSFELTDLDLVPYTVAVGSRVNNKWQNLWTEITLTPRGAEPVDPDPNPDPTGFDDYIARTGLEIDSANGLGHTFGKPCIEDLDGDDVVDIVWSNHYDGPWDVYRGLPNGTFAEDLLTDWSEGDLLTDVSPTDPSLPHKDNHGCAVADFNDDGRADLFEAVGACIGACTKHEGLWIQQLDGSFVNQGETLIHPTPTPDRSRFPVAFDADSDGDRDLFISAVNTGSASSTNRFLRNESGHFSELAVGVDKGQRQVNCTTAADIDNDGDEDLLVCRQFALHIFRNDGSGQFAKVTLGLPKEPVARSVAISDLDGDGRNDLIIVTDDRLQVRRGVGQRFADVSFEFDIEAGRDVVTPDLDGDGRPDIFVVQSASSLDPADDGADFALLNGGDLDFERVEVPQSAAGRGDSAVVLADFWGSGRDAVLVSNGWFGTVGDRQVIAAAGLSQPTMSAMPATIEVRSEPAGAPLAVDGTSTSRTSTLVGTSHSIEAPATITVNGLTWSFDAWTDGGHSLHDVIAGLGTSTFVATYECPLPANDPACSAD